MGLDLVERQIGKPMAVERQIENQIDGVENQRPCRATTTMSGWPYQIAVHTPNGHVKNYTEIHQFIRDRGLNHCDLGHTFQDDKSNFYIVYCFAHADHAAIFQARFGGVQYNRKEWRKRQIAQRKAAGVPAGKR
jgi:hypothetical protein